MKKIKITQSITDRQDTSLKLYFRDVSKQPLIDYKEEVKLAKLIKVGDKKAFDKLIESNLRFVVSVAKQYQNKGLPLVDLIQAGNIGMCEAAKRWNEDKGYKFISYAVWWIRQSILQAISSECRTVRIPMNQIVCMNKINKASAQLEQEFNRTPSVEEISNETEIASKKINLTLTSINKTLSFDSPFRDEDVGCLLDVIPNENCDDADRELIQSNISKKLEDILNKLPFRERDVLRMSYGLGMLPMQNEEIANRFGVGCERVRQIQHEAIEKIRKYYINDLKDLL